MALTPEAEQRLNDLIANGYDYDHGKIWREGVAVWKQNVWQYAGFTFVFWLASAFGNIFVQAHMQAGFYIVAHKLRRNQPHEFNNFFDGFKDYGPMLVMNLVKTLITFVAVMIAMAPGMALYFTTIISAVDGGGEPPIAGMMTGLGLLYALMLPVALYLTISYMFSIALVHFAKADFWPALEMSRKIAGKKFWSLLGLVLLLGLINFLGVLPCYLGLFFTVPLSQCIIHSAYENIIAPALNDGADDAGEDFTRHLIADE